MTDLLFTITKPAKQLNKACLTQPFLTTVVQNHQIYLAKQLNKACLTQPFRLDNRCAEPPTCCAHEQIHGVGRPSGTASKYIVSNTAFSLSCSSEQQQQQQTFHPVCYVNSQQVHCQYYCFSLVSAVFFKTATIIINNSSSLLKSFHCVLHPTSVFNSTGVIIKASFAAEF